MSDDLLPCPFCGCTTINYVGLDRTTTPHHTCDWCAAEGPAEDTDTHPPQGWNIRAALPAVTSDREARLVEALERAARALKPFADRVFNDNGDCTISDTQTLTPPDYWNAQAAERKARALLAEMGETK